MTKDAEIRTIINIHSGENVGFLFVHVCICICMVSILSIWPGLFGGQRYPPDKSLTSGLRGLFC